MKPLSRQQRIKKSCGRLPTYNEGTITKRKGDYFLVTGNVFYPEGIWFGKNGDIFFVNKK